ncbi:bifunctional pantoate--beta-alanine ligase/(d)CMP kinase [Cyanobacterium stanieri LEGE 03274]|uniref:Bifunctional pantoate ligase/cytidylate kinase n=1 Tax=Cyanobacterium stanieri LEGE 03274 TaxID=1828756 RepID=A0ABR9V6S7_9CHRO|nr:bifunctional pantoate--beta-alanine ligase/(d)CMP kinase [Cyanobacterium stanieri]MBE9223613.1 bifunctional pantoate--beta-alanine ligase/(d)CMP kinase [Cyanobacterium stanieri LEGE 03274]
MHIVDNIENLRAILETVKGKSIGFVPTMGALHDGHKSLIKRARLSTDFVVVSIFVNPLQFGINEDLAKYPRQVREDEEICNSLGVNVLFLPSEDAMKTLTEDTTLVTPPVSMMSVLCGKYRKGHFQGVATIVTKLLNLIRPQVAFFGQKDAQQVAIIKRMVDDLFIGVKIESCPIIREDSGLALSSRNQYLTPEQRREARALYGALNCAYGAFLAGERQVNVLIDLAREVLEQEPTIRVQYLEIVDPVSLQPLQTIGEEGLMAIAAYCGTTRLIDNLMLKVKKPIIAIDGPAGAGKSTISRKLAHELGLLYLDTGAMYRAITWLVIDKQISLEDTEAIALEVAGATIELYPSDDLKLPVTVRVNQRDVTKEIRTPAVTRNVSGIAAQKAVREKLVKLQQIYGQQGGIIAEGRDIGTNVFPDADLKIFLTASVKARAKRRSHDLAQQGETNIDLQQLEADIAQRDFLDSTRELAPLQQAPDAIAINTDNLTIEQVIEKIKQFMG